MAMTFSNPTPVQTPQSDWELQLSQILSQLGQQQLGWAQGVYAQTSAVTDTMINNYMANSVAGMGLAANNISRYENMFQPQENNLIQDANTYASTSRIQEAMGAAESATGQAANSGRINAEDTLRSYGIDPSSGRYQELEQAQRAGAAASQAAAGQQAELATEQTGRDLRTQAIQVGQQYPGQAVNALNSSLQGIAGAENAALGNANTGANVMNTVPPYFNAAMSLKYPPVGQNSASGTYGTTATNSGSGSNGAKGNSGGVIPGGGGSGGNGTNPLTPTGGGSGGAAARNTSSGGGGSAGGGVPNAGVYQVPGGGNDPVQPTDPAYAGLPGNAMDPNQIASNPSSTDPSAGQFFDPYSADSGAGNPFNGTPADQNSSTTQDPFAAQGGTQAGGAVPGWGGNNISNNFYDPYSAGGGATDPFSQGGSSTDPFSGSSGGGSSTDPFANATTYGSINAPQTDPNSTYTDPNAGGGGDTSGYSDPNAGSGGDQSQQVDYTSSDDSSGYAAGGGVLPQGNAGPGPTTGGRVPMSASPSMGRNTDDISARLNAGEFVVPRDVAAWKGQEFFQKLIEDARRKRTGAPAKGKPKPALGGPPRFASHPMQRPQQRPQMGAQ